MTEMQEWLNLPVNKERAALLARAIIGPANTGNFPVDREKLEQLRNIRWEQATTQEQGEALSAARAVLAECREQGWFTHLS